jgi:hypothetical protein
MVTASNDLEALPRELSTRLGSVVESAPVHLPPACACLWLGFTGIDRIDYNPDWPGTAIEVVGHAFAHLMLGHCGEIRDGGQFACAVRGADMSSADLDLLLRRLHDPSEGVTRLFSDGEEHAAAGYARTLAGNLGGHTFSDDSLFTCIG